MADEKLSRIRDWVEPGHPAIVKLHDDLVSIYTILRNKFQKDIDSAFDRVSRQIGFIVTTTVPVVFEVSDKGVVKRISMGAEHLKGTIFEKELSAALKGLVGKEGPSPDPWSPGTYKLYLLWFDALNLKLRTHWMEPVQFLRAVVSESQVEAAARVRPEVMEPVHWFDPGTVIAAEEAVLIAVIDEVYPELRLVDRVTAYREFLRKRVRPEVMEPVHPGPTCRPESLEEILKRLRMMRDWL